jgi:uncharacterized protein with ParB-like and HNH nuclease domain
MKANEAGFLDFLKGAFQFSIPIYQRTYSWTEKECRQLWDDIVRAGGNDKITVHFVGSIVYIEEALPTVTRRVPLLVIDGQQRLTTLTLLIAALAKAVGDGEPVDGFSAQMLREYYLVNHLEKEERRYKLILTQTDKASLIAVVNGAQQPKDYSLRVTQNLHFFEKWKPARAHEPPQVGPDLPAIRLAARPLRERRAGSRLAVAARFGLG